MRSLFNTTGSNSVSETSGDCGDFTESFTGKDYYQDLINRANTVPLVKLFKQYAVRLDSYNRKTICPFKSHKGGRETTPSFYYYPETNTFYCFGCKKGTRPCDFVAEINHCTKVQAAHKLLEMFESYVDDDNIYDRNNSSKILEIMLDFSNTVREFYQNYPSEEARVYIEMICASYDALCLKHKFDKDALARTVEQLKNYIGLYKP